MSKSHADEAFVCVTEDVTVHGSARIRQPGRVVALGLLER
jgi:hypothetical protein